MLRRPGSLRGLVGRIGGYQENSRQLQGEALSRTASLIVPLIISFGDAYSIALGRAPKKRCPCELHRRAAHRAVVMDSTGASACIQIDFTPLGAYHFFGLPMRQPRRWSISTTSPMTRSRSFAASWRDLDDWPARLDLAEAFVTERLRRDRAVSAGVTSAYRELASAGNVRIETIAARLDWGRETSFSQRFREEIRICPSNLPGCCAVGCLHSPGMPRRLDAGRISPPDTAIPARRT